MVLNSTSVTRDGYCYNGHEIHKVAGIRCFTKYCEILPKVLQYGRISTKDKKVEVVE